MKNIKSLILKNTKKLVSIFFFLYSLIQLYLFNYNNIIIKYNIILKIKNKLKENKKRIIIILYIILGLYLFYYNYITITRLIVFVIILIVAFIYKYSIEKVEKMQPIKNVNILIGLINIDKIKLLGINLVINLYVLIFEILEFSNKNEIIKILEGLIKNLIIYPILLIIHKLYSILKVGKTTSLKNLLLNRFFGMILIVLIFSPILKLIYMLLNYNMGNVYLLIVLLSIIDENYQKLKKYKYLKFVFLIISFLKFNKDLGFILLDRNKVSIFSIIIEKSIQNIKERNGSINKYAYECNQIYTSVFRQCLNLNNSIFKSIIDYRSELKYLKVCVMKKHLVEENGTLFGFYFNDILSELDTILSTGVTNIKYCKIQLNYKLTQEDRYKLKKVEEIYDLLVKLFLYFIGNVFKLIGIEKDIILNTLKLEDGLAYDCTILVSEMVNEIDKIIKPKDMYKNKDFYDEIYLYNHLNDFSLKSMTYGLNYNKFNYINEYIDIFQIYINKLYHLEGGEEVGSSREMRSMKEEELLKKELEKYRNELIRGWEEESRDLSIANFYEKNKKNLLELRIYIEKEIEINKKIK